MKQQEETNCARTVNPQYTSRGICTYLNLVLFSPSNFPLLLYHRTSVPVQFFMARVFHSVARQIISNRAWGHTTSNCAKLQLPLAAESIPKAQYRYIIIVRQPLLTTLLASK